MPTTVFIPRINKTVDTNEIKNTTSKENAHCNTSTMILWVRIIFTFHVSVICTSTNLFVIVVILKTPRLRKKAGYQFVASIVLTEIIYSIFANIGEIYARLSSSSFILSRSFCQWNIAIVTLCMGQVSWQMALVAIHRCLIVRFNYIYRRIDETFYKIGFNLLPRLLIIPLLSLMIGQRYAIYSKYNICWTTNSKLITFILVAYAIVPSVIIIVCYVTIILFIRVKLKPIFAVGGSRQETWFKNQRHIFEVLAITYIHFILGYFPFTIMQLVDKGKSSAQCHIIIFLLTLMMFCKETSVFTYILLDVYLQKRLGSNLQSLISCIRKMPIPTTTLPSGKQATTTSHEELESPTKEISSPNQILSKLAQLSNYSPPTPNFAAIPKKGNLKTSSSIDLGIKRVSFAIPALNSSFTESNPQEDNEAVGCKEEFFKEAKD